MATTCYVATVLHFHTYLLLLIRKHLVNTHLSAGEILTGIYKIRPVARDLIAGRCVLISACIFLYKLVQNGKHDLKLFPARFERPSENKPTTASHLYKYKIRLSLKINDEITWFQLNSKDISLQ